MEYSEHVKKPELDQVKITDSFWNPYIRLVKDVVIPYQWETLNDRNPDTEPSYAVENLKIAAGLATGEYKGLIFLDSDLAKWLEAVAYTVHKERDAQLEEKADSIIDLFALAQCDDGYVNSYYCVNGLDKRWTNLCECHELYCAGHLIEAAVAYYKATGKKKFLDIMDKYVDHIIEEFGPEEHKRQGYPGHQEIELALVKFYELTSDEKYLKLASYFIDQRGQQPYYFDEEWEKRGHDSYWSGENSKKPSLNGAYWQASQPVRDQETATGHAVRAVYMYTAMADLARETGDASLLEACRTLWNNMTHRQMYINGSIGATAHGEAFTFDYDLPNDTIYAETCASIGLIFFAQRMLMLEAKGEYGDVMENALYNTVLASMAKDGKHYFYVNPLEVNPESSLKDPSRTHVKSERQGWFGCACCPPNVARLLSSLESYLYTQKGSTLYTHLYVDSTADFLIEDQKVRLTQKTSYPFDGQIVLTVEKEEQQSAGSEFTVAVRIPGWCTDFQLYLNNALFEKKIENGYIYIQRHWNDHDRIEIRLDMTPKLFKSNPKIRNNMNKYALKRGPILYCLEEEDNGPVLQSLLIDPKANITSVSGQGVFEGTLLLELEGYQSESVNREALYLEERFEEQWNKKKITAVPYFLWGNRYKGEMLVWLNARLGQ